MNDFDKTLEKQLQDLGSRFTLSETERSFHRAELLKIMGQKKPLNATKTPSPYTFGYFLRKHAVSAAVLLIVVLGASVTASASNALPNDYLYPVKIKINEPLMLLLTPQPEEKVQLKVALVEKHLQEFSKVILTENIDQDKKDAFVEQLSDQVDDLHGDIKDLANHDDASAALEAANDLQSILSTQDEVLDKVHDANPDAENTDALESAVQEDAEATSAIVNDVSTTASSTEDQAKLDDIISNLQKEISDSVQNIETEKESIPEETSEESLDILNQSNIESKLSDIQDRLKKIDQSDKESAINEYNKIDQALGGLESLIEAQKNINTDK